MSVNKWFKKQHRTDADSTLDKINPNRPEPPPIDNDDEKVAPSTDRSHMSTPPPGDNRPLKGGYWFIREMYRAEVDAAIAKYKEKLGRPRPELEARLGPHPSRSPMMLEAPRQETVPVVGHSRQRSEQPMLPDLTRPPGPQLDPLTHWINLDQRFLLLLPLERGPIPQRRKIQTRPERNTSLESSHNRMSYLSFNHIFSFSIRIFVLGLESAARNLDLKHSGSFFIGCHHDLFYDLRCFTYVGLCCDDTVWSWKDCCKWGASLFRGKMCGSIESCIISVMNEPNMT